MCFFSRRPLSFAQERQQKYIIFTLFPNILPPPKKKRGWGDAYNLFYKKWRSTIPVRMTGITQEVGTFVGVLSYSKSCYAPLG